MPSLEQSDSLFHSTMILMSDGCSSVIGLLYAQFLRNLVYVLLGVVCNQLTRFGGTHLVWCFAFA